MQSINLARGTVAGLDDLTSKANERWTRAERYARGFADNGMGEALRVYYTRYFPAGLVLYVGALILIASLLYGDELPNWALVLQGGAPPLRCASHDRWAHL